ncbi:MAG TPA: 3-oxo-tetronate kinase, partial [Albitalea sp.]|nr:3-oxo-tetronate kinase [Albitalea sp.]
TDVASMLVRAGMRTVQVIGVPANEPAPEADAVVVALKSRTTPAAQAVNESLAALRWLQDNGARQFYFKYCSTFDSTPAGNIGPVAEALMAALQTDFAIACPAFPENGRTVFRGHLFVGDQLLSDSGMREHPLTPMTDANLVRVLQAQSRGRVGLLRHDTVAAGIDAVRARFDALRADGVSLAVADALADDDLRTLAAACDGLPLITAGSGIALGLPAVYAARGWLQPDAQAALLPIVGGHAAAISGSCSLATNEQVRHWLAAGRPGFRVDARALAGGEPVAAQALAFAKPRLADGPVLVYATSAPDEVRDVQAALGVQRSGTLVEHCLAQVAAGLVEAGVRRLAVAGGETSGAVVQALGVRRLRIGAAIAPGVPWTQAEGRALLLALKSGNFGAADFFSHALAQVA